MQYARISSSEAEESVKSYNCHFILWARERYDGKFIVAHTRLGRFVVSNCNIRRFSSAKCPEQRRFRANWGCTTKSWGSTAGKREKRSRHFVFLIQFAWWPTAAGGGELLCCGEDGRYYTLFSCSYLPHIVLCPWRCAVTSFLHRLELIQGGVDLVCIRDKDCKNPNLHTPSSLLSTSNCQKRSTCYLLLQSCQYYNPIKYCH